MTASAKPAKKPLAIFRPGTHVASDGKRYTFSEADVQDIAASYDPKLGEAPLVVGHPKTDDPAYGWAKSVSFDDGLLIAEPHQVEPQFAEMVNAGRFKTISASIYLPDTPGNPKPGHHYLRHIGFLGAQAPGVKGLPSASFAEGDGAVEFAMPLAGLGYSLVDLFQRMRDYLIDRDGLEKADLVIPQWQIRSIDEFTSRDDNRALGSAFAEPPNQPEIEMSQTADFAERERKLAEQTTSIEQREKALKDRETAAQRADAVAFAEGLVKEGKLLPRSQAAVVELVLAMPAGTSLSFSEGDQQVSKPAATVLRDFLTGLPKLVDFSEKSRDEGGAETVDFAAPPGQQVDTGALELHAKATAYQQQHPGTSWIAAVKAVGG